MSIFNKFFFKVEEVQSLIPYYFPNYSKFRKRKFIYCKYAYQLLYFGEYEQALNLAKLALKINTKNEKLWLIFLKHRYLTNYTKTH